MNGGMAEVAEPQSSAEATEALSLSLFTHFVREQVQGQVPHQGGGSGMSRTCMLHGHLSCTWTNSS